VQVSVPVDVSGSGRERDWTSAAGCRLDRNALERHGAGLLRAAGFDVLRQGEVLNRLQLIQKELVAPGSAPSEIVPGSFPLHQE
jgi:hypothetical protein